MNTFFCKTDRPIKFLGSINEDVNAYVMYGNRGDLFFTWTPVCIQQERTQKQKGGLTEAYLEVGTYVKSFYSVIVAPQAVRVGVVGNKDMRLHHSVTWNACAPKILNEKWRK